MSKNMASESLAGVKTERPRRHTKGPTELAVNGTPKVSAKSQDYGQQLATYKIPKVSGNSEFVFVNNAYVGSLDSVNENRLTSPPTSVIREQYWACSKWPFTQRVLAIAVGVLLGAVIGLALTVSFSKRDREPNLGLPTRSAAPD